MRRMRETMIMLTIASVITGAFIVGAFHSAHDAANHGVSLSTTLPTDAP